MWQMQLMKYGMNSPEVADAEDVTWNRCGKRNMDHMWQLRQMKYGTDKADVADVVHANSRHGHKGRGGPMADEVPKNSSHGRKGRGS